jgi:hypothetical protein
MDITMTTPDSTGRGGASERLMRDALIVALNEDGEGPDGRFDAKLKLVAQALVDKAVEGDAASIKEIFDRVGGRAGTAAERPVARSITQEEAVDQLD